MMVTTNRPPVVCTSSAVGHLYHHKEHGVKAHLTKQERVSAFSFLPETSFAAFVCSLVFVFTNVVIIDISKNNKMSCLYVYFLKNLWRCNISKFQFVCVSPSVSSVSNVFYLSFFTQRGALPLPPDFTRCDSSRNCQPHHRHSSPSHPSHPSPHHPHHVLGRDVDYQMSISK